MDELSPDVIEKLGRIKCKYPNRDQAADHGFGPTSSRLAARARRWPSAAGLSLGGSDQLRCRSPRSTWRPHVYDPIAHQLARERRVQFRRHHNSIVFGPLRQLTWLHFVLPVTGAICAAMGLTADNGWILLFGLFLLFMTLMSARRWLKWAINESRQMQAAELRDRRSRR